MTAQNYTISHFLKIFSHNNLHLNPQIKNLSAFFFFGQFHRVVEFGNNYRSCLSRKYFNYHSCFSLEKTSNLSTNDIIAKIYNSIDHVYAIKILSFTVKRETLAAKIGSVCYKWNLHVDSNQ